jgi:SAM-dependent methyltransferase
VPEDIASRRFRSLDPYRVQREWDRYEGTAQRRLFRELRTRFLDRHARDGGWVLDLGSGPGRFLPHIGGPSSRRVAVDLSVEMLRRVERSRRAHPDLVRGDGTRPPFRPAAFGEVVVLGNAIGFAGSQADLLWRSAADLVTPSGTLVLEVVAGAGERSRYLARLPASSLARLLRAPARALLPRIDAEGFVEEPTRRTDPGDFRRYDPFELSQALAGLGWGVREVLAVAPALGADPDRLEHVARDPQSWERLLRLEELLGARRERITRSPAVLLAASRGPPNGGIK